MTNLSFDSRLNYLKRDTSTGNQTISGPNTLNAWLNYQSTKTVAHNLGYVPQVRVYYDPYNNGKLFKATGNRLSGGSSYNNSMICVYEVNATNLIISLESFFNLGGSVPIYWVIYLDH